VGFAKLIERCSDGGEDQGAEEAFIGKAMNHYFGKRAVSRERLFVEGGEAVRYTHWAVQAAGSTATKA